jgi:hypothetical protein
MPGAMTESQAASLIANHRLLEMPGRSSMSARPTPGKLRYRTD